MVTNYKYLSINIDSWLTLAHHITETKRKVDSRFNMVMAILNLNMGVNTRMLITLYNSLIQCIILYAAPNPLLACDSALQSLESIQRIPLHYILGLPSEASSILLYRELGIIHSHLLIKEETATHLLRTASKPIETEIVHKEETQEDPRVFSDASWSIKAAWF